VGHRAARPRGDTVRGGALTLDTTPSQTVGPFFSIGLVREGEARAVPGDEPGAIRLTGTVYDGEGERVPDALIETWQTQPRELFARCGCEAGEGEFEIVTLQPGDDTPWIDVSVFARGMLNRVVTRVYFSADDVPDAVPAERRETLVAAADGDGRYRFDIRLQGPGETVFFDV
jgi:protocatechuate 3,4-dioxygenase, alpha subunit